MPELPEVETIKRDLEKTVVGQTILEVYVHDTMVVRNLSAKRFKGSLAKQTIIRVDRRGKAIIFEMKSGCFLIVQPMMTGQLVLGLRTPQARVYFKLSNGQYLNYNDQRRFGRLTLVDHLSEMKFLRTIGVEPLSGAFNPGWLKTQMRFRKTPIKNLLMNQNFIAGIGNIYASEILFRCGINPQRAAGRLKIEEIKLLHEQTVSVLNEAIQFRGSSVNNYRDAKGEKGHFVNRIQVYGRENEKCVRCQRPIQRIVQSGRSTFFCKRCQS